MEHIGEVVLCDPDGKGFDLAGPYRDDPIADRRQRKAADSIK